MDKMAEALSFLTNTLDPRTHFINPDEFDGQGGFQTYANGIMSTGDDQPLFRFYHPKIFQNLKHPHYFGIKKPQFLSSAGGFVLVRADDGSYNVVNPFIQLPAGHRVLPEPPNPQLHDANTPAIIGMEEIGRCDMAFRVVCIIDLGVFDNAHRYRHEVYSSRTNKWYSVVCSVAQESSILSNTGIATDDGFVVWLTNGHPPMVVGTSIRFEPLRDRDRQRLGLDLEEGDQMQLGTLYDRSIGLVVSTVDHVHLFRMRITGHLERVGRVEVRREGVDIVGQDPLSVLCRLPQQKVDIMRFARDVPLWVNGRLLIWEVNADRQRLHVMPAWEAPPETGIILNSAPFKKSFLMPGSLRLEEDVARGLAGAKKVARHWDVMLLDNYEDVVDVMDDEDEEEDGDVVDIDDEQEAVMDDDY